jgi:hypothetical protein
MAMQRNQFAGGDQCDRARRAANILSVAIAVSRIKLDSKILTACGTEKFSTNYETQVR